MKKVLSIIKTTLVWLIVALAVFMMIFTIVSVTTFNRNDRSIFGYKAYIVNSDSMAYEEDGSAGLFAAGDLIFVKEVAPSELREGDVITYLSQNTESFGEAITHKIRSLTIDAEGNPGFITYGTTTGTDDETVVTYPYVLGKYQGHIPKLGSFFNFMKTTPGYIVCIFVPFMLLIIYQGVKFFRLFRRYKKEQMEELEEERSKIEEERKQSAEMLLKLQELQVQLSLQQESTGKTQGAPDAPPEQATISPTETKEEVKLDPTEE